MGTADSFQRPETSRLRSEPEFRRLARLAGRMPDQQFERLQDTLAQFAVGDAVQDTAEGLSHSPNQDAAGDKSEVLPDNPQTKEDPLS